MNKLTKYKKYNQFDKRKIIRKYKLFSIHELLYVNIII